MIETLRRRLPKPGQIIQVYSVVAFFVYGWEAYRFMWRLPSWLHYLTLGDLFGVFSYAMLAGLSESILILGLLLGLCLVVPGPLQNNFVSLGTAILLGWFCALIGFWIVYEQVTASVGEYVEIWTLGALILAGLLAWLARKSTRLASVFVSLADRTIIFLYLLLPLSALGIVIVLFRNLL